MDVRFRVSPSSFFQTNSAGAAILYKTIAEKCGLCKSDTSVSQTAIGSDIISAVSEKDLNESVGEDSCKPEIKRGKFEEVDRFLKI